MKKSIILGIMVSCSMFTINATHTLIAATAAPGEKQQPQQQQPNRVTSFLRRAFSCLCCCCRNEDQEKIALAKKESLAQYQEQKGAR